MTQDDIPPLPSGPEVRGRGFVPDLLPTDFGDVAAEVHATRQAAALFDFSFLIRIELEGAGTIEAAEQFAGRRIDDLAPGRIRYALHADAEGRLLSDLTIWRTGERRVEVMTGRAQDVEALAALVPPACAMRDLSSETCVLAVQGPETAAVLDPLTADTTSLAALPFYGFLDTTLAGVPARIARLGYTGEFGCELVLPATHGPALWERLARHARPAGFVAADILRIEAGFVLFANEFRPDITAAEAGLAAFADAAAERERRCSLVCFSADAAKTPRLWAPGPDVSRPEHPGILIPTSACWSARAGRVLGFGLVAGDAPPEGTALQDPSGTFENARVEPRPYYRPPA